MGDELANCRWRERGFVTPPVCDSGLPETKFYCLQTAGSNPPKVLKYLPTPPHLGPIFGDITLRSCSVACETRRDET